jgi:hypothetical protein
MAFLQGIPRLKMSYLDMAILGFASTEAGWSFRANGNFFNIV